MEGFDLSTVSGIYMGSSEISALYLGDTLIYPTNYEEEYLTICSLDTNNNVTLQFYWDGFAQYSNVTFTIYVSRNKKTWYSYTVSYNNTVANLGTLGRANKLYIKGYSSNYYQDGFNARIYCNGRFKLQGNIMSLFTPQSGGVDGDFNNVTTLGNNALRRMFAENIYLVDIENLYTPATTLGDYCYADLFRGCTRLTDVSTLDLSVTTLGEGCYSGMFKNCTGLTDVSDLSLPATTLGASCYKEMFSGCTSLTTPPTLPATTLGDECYASMFYNCTSLTTAPSLLATTVGAGCYKLMFNNCVTLTTAPSSLPATTLGDECYASMFSGCTSLRTAPSSLPATIAGVNCYSGMFYNCTSLTTGPSAISATTLGQQSCYAMFKNCESLTTAPSIAATTLARQSCREMFMNCTSLTTGPSSLPATVLTEECYKDMFNYCISLTTVPTISAIAVAKNCCYGMFYVCESLTSAPALNTTIMQQSCYAYMFSGCTSLTTAPALPATTLATRCYSGMFYGCTALTSAPALPATRLSDTNVGYCYEYMFANCTSLTTAPDLLSFDNPSNNMFNGCTSLNYIKCLAKNPGSITDWVKDVAATGTFVRYPNIQWNRGDDGIPTGWSIQEDGQIYTVSLTPSVNGTSSISANSGITGETIYVYTTPDQDYKFGSLTVTSNGNPVQTYVNDSSSYYFYIPNGDVTVTVTYVERGYDEEYLTIESLAAENIFRWRCNNAQYPSTIYYSIDKINWHAVTSSTSGSGALIRHSYNSGDKIYLKGSYSGQSNALCWFTATGNFKVYGNIMSLTDGDNFANATTLTNDYQLCALFSGNEYLIDAYNLVLPATTLTPYCYRQMFYNCSYLAVGPQTLPATTLTTHCYDMMFYNCFRLTDAPMLPATTLASHCYWAMFGECTSLISVQAELPATTLATECYYSMFADCTSLNSAPTLPATVLVDSCYKEMFWGCSSLSYIKCLATDISATDCTKNWVKNVASSGTFVKSNSMTSWTTGDNGIPTNWTIPAPLSITIYSSQNGSVTSDKQVAGAGETVTLTVTPDAGYGLDTLTVLNSNLNPVTITATQQGYEFTMPSSNVTVSATFSTVSYAITVNSAQHGSVTSNKQSAAYGEEITLTVSPDTGYELDTLTVVDANSNPVTVTAITGGYKFDMPASNVTVSAVFDTLSYTITIGQTTDGTVTSDKNTARYGDTVTLTITPDTGYSLDNLTVVDANSNPITVTNNQFTMPASNVSVSATFIIPYDSQYLTIESLEDNNAIGWKSNDSNTKTIQWSTDKTTWTSVTSSTSGEALTTLNTGDKLYIKGTNNTYGATWSTWNYFTATNDFNVYGHINSLLYGDNFTNNKNVLPSGSCTFWFLFNASPVVDASNLILPNAIRNMGYAHMFEDCNKLQYAPELPSVCTYQGYNSMFKNCTSLTTAPITRFSDAGMYGCESLFNGCTSLNSVTTYITSLGTDGTRYWLNNVAATGTFTKLASMTSFPSGGSGIPSGWTVVDVQSA